MPWAWQVQEQPISFPMKVLWEAQLLYVTLLCGDYTSHACSNLGCLLDQSLHYQLHPERYSNCCTGLA